jgi:F-type H+-transporting ATPase subunit epsilon
VGRKLNLDIVTPKRRILSEDVQYVALPGVQGELGILYGHAPLVAGLTIGVSRFGELGGKMRRAFISGGFVEVRDNRVIVLADAAELAEEIDVVRAQAAKERAERRLRERAADLDFRRASSALQRAIYRLKTAEEGKS